MSGKSKEEGKDQESIQSSPTPCLGHRMGKLQKHKKTPHTMYLYKRAKRPALSQHVHQSERNTELSVQAIKGTLRGPYEDFIELNEL